MKAKLWIILVFIGLNFCSVSYGETIRVGLEPFPPLIIDSTSGYTIIMLKEIEKISDLRFTINIMPYNRAKLYLDAKKIDLIGHTPYGMETKEFYVYAKELDWKIKAISAMFSTIEANVEPDEFKILPRIGTPYGNKDFFSELFEIPLENFKESNLDNLLKMLSAERIDGFIFERFSTMTSLIKLDIKNIFYKNMEPSVDASCAIRNDTEGIELRHKLDQLIKKLNHKKIFGDYLKYLDLPKSGVVSVLFIGSEIIAILKIDNISQFSHLAGGFIGAGYGFIRSGQR